MKKYGRFTVAIIAVMALAACSDSGSEPGSDTSTSQTLDYSIEFLRDCVADPSDEGCPPVEEEQVTKTFTTSPTDILFVLDESCSMSAIANSMRNGFASLQTNQYPDDTKMAVTYMSPVKLDVLGDPDFTTPFITPAVSPLMPGHMKLVNKSSIDAFMGAFPAHTSAFPMSGCDDSWFLPGSRNTNGDFCLSAAVQLADVCTGVEAGLVAVEQLTKKMALSGQRLFRPKAFVNIFLVSDTHEPGGNYFGRTGAPAGMRSTEELISIIYQNNPGISSVKVAGILPVPKVGHPLLDDLRVIGPIPTTDAEAKVSSEGFWDYSYLPYISFFRGVVSHAKSSDWSAMAQALIDDTKYTGNILVTLASTAKRVYFVTVNGVVLEQNQFSLNSDKRTVTLKYSSPTNVDLEISILYE